ncbi:MAG: hypothetical protein M1415_06945 [Firmicutes bacterium]|nr:hypothetical protein [Bacillota bacterium]MCL5065940.1 hypothetical protein [Bacillota bacterium]
MEVDSRHKPERVAAGHRWDRLEDLVQMVHCPMPTRGRVTTLYAREASHNQKADVERQVILLSEFWIKNGWTHEMIRD